MYLLICMNCLYICLNDKFKILQMTRRTWIVYALTVVSTARRALRAVPMVETNTVFIAQEIIYRNYSPQWQCLRVIIVFSFSPLISPMRSIALTP
jgi:hypothetical protein